MSNRLSIRPQIPNLIQDDMSVEEVFQNKVLRPILKMQHDLLILVFKTYFVKQKNKFYQIADQQKAAYIQQITTKDSQFRNKLIGLIIGHFTLEEYQAYQLRESALNKRIMTMLQKRILDSLEEFGEM